MASDSPVSQFDRDVVAVGRITSVPSILQVLCEMTGMGFAAVARVTDDRWVTCAVQDQIGFGLVPGGELDVKTTLCREVREVRTPIAIDHASIDPVYAGHHTPRTYSIESYVSVPIVLGNGEYFGNLCAIDPKPAQVSNSRTVSTFVHFAALIAHELDNQWRSEAVMRELLDERAGGALREEFIAVLGHDLRNPLAAISASAQLMVRKPGDAERVVELSGRIGTNVGRMSKLIEDLLDFARGRLGGGIRPATESIDDMAQLIEGVVDELRTAHPNRLLTTTLTIERAVPGDSARVQQLVSNLVANAITHGADDSPIAIGAVVSGTWLEISVHNLGEPIPEKTLPGIFDAFTRHDTSTRRKDGLGLGLHICSQIVKAHGGDISVTSRPDVGTTFVARLPAPAER